VEKHRSNPQYFKEKNYKVKILTTSIFKSKINKNNFVKNKLKKKAKIGKLKKKVILKKKSEKKTKKKKKLGKKERKSTVDYCCNPQCFWVWGNSDFPTPFSYMYNVAVVF
jgi:hypothetical protein